MKRSFPVLLPGIAAGATWEAACRSALLEVIERDATMIWWVAGLDALELRVSEPDRVFEIVTAGTDDAIELRWFLVPSDFEARTVACLLMDRRNGFLVLGFATRPRVDDALLKATAEAFQSRVTSAAMTDPSSSFWVALRAGRLGPLELKPFREDRAYKSLYRADHRDMHALIHNEQYYLDPTTWSDAEQAKLIQGLWDHSQAVGTSDLKTTLTRVRDWPSWATDPQRPYALDPSIGALAVSARSFAFDASDLPPAPAYA